jgi:non-specific serine/threonine protein kinase
VPSRHQTLQAALDWSYRLLDSAEKVLLNRLSVFAGGFTLEAVEGVAGDGPSSATLDLLTALVDKSLVRVEHSTWAVRYRLLETVRQYARARLAESGEAERIHERHARFYLAFAETSEPKLFRGERAAWLEGLNQEHDNLRAALDWSRSTNAESLTLRLCGALLWFWHFGGYFSEWQTHVQEALRPDALADVAGKPEQAAALGKVAWGAGLFAWIQGDFAVARARCEASLPLLRQANDTPHLAHALSNLGMVALSEGRLTEARTLTAEAVTLARKAGREWDLALLLYNAGAVIDAQGDEAAARKFLEESRALFQRLGDRWGQSISLVHLGLMAARRIDYTSAHQLIAGALTMQRAEGDVWGNAASLALLGQIAQKQGALSTARDVYSECIHLIQERVGDKATLAIALHGLGGVAWAQGEPRRAARLLAAALSLQNATGGTTPLSLTSREDVERDLAAVRAALGDAEFDAAWRQGPASV